MADDGTTLLELHGPLFDVAITDRYTHIYYAGQKLIKIKVMGKLPKGFHEQLVQEIYDLVTGKRPDLWKNVGIHELPFPRQPGRITAPTNKDRTT